MVTGTPRPGLPEGLYLCCVFGDVEVPAEQVSPGVLRCRAPPNGAGRVPFYISCLGSGEFLFIVVWATRLTSCFVYRQEAGIRHSHL